MNKAKVLVVEDDSAILSDLGFILEQEGYRVLCATNGEEALRILNEGEELPRVVLLDIMMPVMDGWKFREQQCADKRISDIPVVVMTADGRAAQKAATMKAQGYVQKPIDIDILLRAIVPFAS